MTRHPTAEWLAHAELADAILAQGALVSEMPFGHEPRARDFPRQEVFLVRSSGQVARISAGVLRPSICIAEMMRELARDFCRSKDDPPAAKPATPLRSADAQPGHQTATNLHQTCVLLMKVRCNVHV